MAEKMKEKQYEFESVLDDELFRFESIGDTITGLVLAKDRSVKYNVGLYEIETIEGENKRILGKTHLDRLMEKVPVGSVVRIEYVEDRDTASGVMKLFDVGVAKQK